MSRLTLVEQATAPSTPSAGQASLYVKNTKQLAMKDDTGAETVFTAGGEVNTGANVGGGAGVFRDKTGVTLNFRSLVAGASMLVTQAADTISIALSSLTATLNAANQALTGIKTATFNGEVDNGNVSGAATITWANGQRQRATLVGVTTFTFSAPPGPGNFMLKIVQDATGGRTVTWPASVRWPNGTAPAVSSGGPNAIHIIAFYYDGTNYYGVGSLSFA